MGDAASAKSGWPRSPRAWSAILVTQWTDQSGNANHASAASGSVTYPSAILFPVGAAGVSFGPPAESLQLVDSADARSLLDFNGDASTHSGFSILLSVKADQLNATNWNDLLGITSATTGGFGLRYSSSGIDSGLHGRRHPTAPRHGSRGNRGKCGHLRRELRRKLRLAHPVGLAEWNRSQRERRKGQFCRHGPAAQAG